MTIGNLEKTCDKCGARNPDIARFCGSCGNLLESSLDRPTGPVSELGALDEHADDVTSGGALITDHEHSLHSHAPPAPDAPADAPPPPASPPQQVPAPPQQDRRMPPPGGDPYQPGAGLAPGASIPPPGQPPPAQGPPVQQPYGVPPPGYGYSMPQDGNTSGMGDSFPAPEFAKGWNFGGFVPFGLYSFVNGSALWGAIGLIASFFGMYLIYSIVAGIMGKEQAWKNRRFDNVEQFNATMRVWNSWGLALLVLGIVFWLLYFLFFVWALSLGIAEEF